MRELVRAHSIDRACLVGRSGGYSITVWYASEERVLATSRGDIRTFTLENAGKFLLEMGLPRFEVDATGYQPGRLRKPRPDRAAALRKTRTAMRQGDLLA